MPLQLFNLRNVPDDEAEDIRELLEQHAIDYYETPPGNWGISIPALWLRDDSQLARARELIDGYQAQRLERARREYQAPKQTGRQRTILDKLRENPLRFLLALAFALTVLYFSTRPFLDLGG